MSLLPSRPSFLCQLSGAFLAFAVPISFRSLSFSPFFVPSEKKYHFLTKFCHFPRFPLGFLLESPPVSDKIQEKRLFKKGAVKMYDPFDHRWIPIYDQSFLLRIFLMLLLLLLPGGILYLILSYVWQRLQDRHHQRGVFS